MGERSDPGANFNALQEQLKKKMEAKPQVPEQRVAENAAEVYAENMSEASADGSEEQRMEDIKELVTDVKDISDDIEDAIRSREDADVQYLADELPGWRENYLADPDLPSLDKRRFENVINRAQKLVDQRGIDKAKEDLMAA
jgi:hypothetical protein